METRYDIAKDIQPYMYEPNPGEHQDDSDNSESVSLISSKDEVDEEFDAVNSWRLSSLEWCKCGHCDIMVKSIESFCCHEKVVEYDEKL